MISPGLFDVARYRSLPFYNAKSGKILINRQGLVANNVNNIEGRGNYFPGTAGTSEGQLLLTKGVADAFRVTGDGAWEPLLDRLIEGMNYLYGTEPVAHWLFVVRGAFIGEKLHYSRLFSFADGVAVIPESSGGGLTKNIYHVRSFGSDYVWMNPYSSLTSGSFYPMASVTQNPDKTTTVTLVDSGFTGDAFIMYSTLEGNAIVTNELFEAWPAWRKLDPGEINVAMDSVAWSLDAYKSIMLALNDTATYLPKIESIASAVTPLYEVNDGRSWITQRLVDPLQVAGSFVYAEVAGLVVEMDVDGSILFAMPAVPAPAGTVTETRPPDWYDAELGVPEPPGIPTNWTSETQFGRAISDTITAADSISIKMTASRAITVDVFIDTAPTYDPSTRYVYQCSLATGFNDLTIDVAQFVNGISESLAVWQTVFIVGWGVSQTHKTTVSPFELSVHVIRPVPLDSLSYMPGVCPFTCNFIAGNQISWRGPVYTGYQDPNVWDYVSGSESLADVILDFLIDAQAHYTSVFPGETGPFAPVYYLQRYDSVEYGTPGTFGWVGPDPSTGWEGYQYRPLFETARYLNAHPTSAKAKQIVGAFIGYLNNHFDSVKGFPTDYPSDSTAQHNYFSPHALFMVMGAAVCFEHSGHGNAASAELLQKAATLAVDRFQNGIWANAGDDWFGFWNGVILSVLALIKEFDLPIFSNAQLDAFFSNNLIWLMEHTE